MTKLEEIKQREAKATPGPWRREANTLGVLRTILALKIKVIATYPYAFSKVDGINLEFITHARSDIPYLLRRLEAAEAVITTLTATGFIYPLTYPTALALVAWEKAKEGA